MNMNIRLFLLFTAACFLIAGDQATAMERNKTYRRNIRLLSKVYAWNDDRNDTNSTCFDPLINNTDWAFANRSHINRIATKTMRCFYVRFQITPDNISSNCVFKGMHQNFSSLSMVFATRPFKDREGVYHQCFQIDIQEPNDREAKLTSFENFMDNVYGNSTCTIISVNRRPNKQLIRYAFSTHKSCYSEMWLPRRDSASRQHGRNRGNGGKKYSYYSTANYTTELSTGICTNKVSIQDTFPSLNYSACKANEVLNCSNSIDLLDSQAEKLYGFLDSHPQNRRNHHTIIRFIKKAIRNASSDGNTRYFSSSVLQVIANLVESSLKINGTIADKQEIRRLVETIMRRVQHANRQWEYETKLFSTKVLDVERSELLYTNVTTQKDGAIINVNLPNTALFATKESIRISLVHYSGNDLFQADDTPGDQIISINVGKQLTGISNFVEITFLNNSAQNGKEVIPGTMLVRKTVVKCVFYNEINQQWENDGCYIDEHSPSVRCYCNHLTSFSILVSTVDVPADISLSIVSYVGCVLSSVCLIFHLTLIGISKKWKKKRPVLMMMHVSACLCISYIIFLLGIGQTQNRAVCITVTASLQYLFLATWCWLGVYAREMYKYLVKVFLDIEARFMLKVTCIAYSTPLVITAVTIGITVGYFDERHTNNLLGQGKVYISSTYYSENACWLHDESLNFGFLVPVGLILLHNFIVLVRVSYEMVIKMNSIESSASKKDMKERILFSCASAFLIGTTWVFGWLLQLSTDLMYVQIFSWLFAIFCSTQGLFIFLILCVRNKNMRALWWPVVKRCLTCDRRQISDESYSVNVSDLNLKKIRIAASRSTVEQEISNSHKRVSFATDETTETVT